MVFFGTYANRALIPAKPCQIIRSSLGVVPSAHEQSERAGLPPFDVTQSGSQPSNTDPRL
jgi:hypothetical protein